MRKVEAEINAWKFSIVFQYKIECLQTAKSGHSALVQLSGAGQYQKKDLGRFPSPFYMCISPVKIFLKRPLAHQDD